MPRSRQATSRFLATVLFTDIVGSTERAADLGDRAWRDLLDGHHGLVRRELRAFRGREMGTAGDGFLALFESPEQAVRCAESIITQVAALGLRVRAGVHTGECEVLGGEVAGMAVHIGSRVAALAEPGQVLVTSSVRDLMTGSDRRFAGGEARALKGVSEQWRLYRLVLEPVDRLGATAQWRAGLPMYSRGRRRRLLVVLAAVTVLALAFSTTYVLTRSEAEVVVGENAVGVIGPGDEPRFGAAVDVGQRPTALAAGFGSVWVTNSSDDSVSRIDRRTRTAVPIPVGASPAGVAVGTGSVWVANSGDNTVTRIDPTTGRQTTIDVRPAPTGIVVAFGSVWVTNALDASVTEIDPDTNTVVEVVPVGAGPTGIAAGDGYLWVTNQGDGTVTRFHPDTYQTDSPVTVGTGPVGIAVEDGAAWVTNNLEGSLSRIDTYALTVEARTLDADGGAYGVAARGGDVWVSNQHAGTLMRVTADTFRLSQTVRRLRGAPLGLAYVGKDLWFTSAAGGSALHRGGVLNMVGPRIRYKWLDKPRFDPTVQWDEQSWRLASLLYDGLVGFRRAGGAQGAVPVPDLATHLPTPTDGGLTYAFHLRKGVRYSTGEPVLAGDIRRGIERAVVHPGDTPDYYARAIVGARACARAAKKAAAAENPRPDCDLSQGISTDDRTGAVTIHLIRPTADFLYQLALPFAFAVPQDTPVDPAPGAFPPATGPYMISSYTPKQDAAVGRPARPGRLELVRNPEFRVWSPAAQPDGYPDRIVLDTGYTAEQAVAQVASGRADVAWLTDEPLAHPDQLQTRYGPQLHTAAGTAASYVFLNARRPPFMSRDARRAVAYALDRGVLASGRGEFSGPVTCQMIPPNFVSYRPHCPFTLGGDDGQWTGLDLATAQDLVERSGTRGEKVVLVVVDDWPAMRRAGRRVVALLDRLGYRASLRSHPWPDFYDALEKPDVDFDAGVWGWAPDYPAPSQLLATLASCNRDLETYNLTGFCDPELDKAISAALDLQATDPAGASDAWAAIDHAVVDAAAYIPFSNSLRQNFVSARVGNVEVHPVTGPLIAQMWVQ